MPNMRYSARPLTDWSSEIRDIPTLADAQNPASGAQATAGLQYPAASMPPDAPPAFQFPSQENPGPAASNSAAPAVTPTAPAVSQAPAASQAPAVSQAASTPAAPATRPARHPAHNEFAGSTGNLDLQNHQPSEVIEAPASTGEAFLGSLKSMLLRNRGNFVAATLLIGSQGTTVWEGILHEVGNDYFIIYQTGRQRYILCDIYALKYMEFYDTKQRELCEHLLQENGEQSFC